MIKAIEAASKAKAPVSEGHVTTILSPSFMNAVSPGSFRTMKTPLLEGRDFRDGDAKEIASDKDSGVAIVNRRFAAHFFPGKSAVGKRIGWDDGPATKLSIEIVGVVADSLYEGPREGVHRQVFVPSPGV